VASVVETDNKVYSDIWDIWLRNHSGSVIVTRNPYTQEIVLRTFENNVVRELTVIPSKWISSWYPSCKIKCLPKWAVKALLDAGEIPAFLIGEAQKRITGVE